MGLGAAIAGIATSIGTGLTAAAPAIGGIAAATTAATSIAGAVKGSKAQEEQLGLQKKQFKEENRAREAARKKSKGAIDSGFSGTILAPRGLGGQGAISTGKSTLLGG
jgi:hypothetical protein